MSDWTDDEVASHDAWMADYADPTVLSNTCNCPKCQPDAPPRQRVFAFLGYNYAIQGIFEEISVSGDPVKGTLYPDGYLERDDTGEGLMPTYGSTVFYGPF